jgi:hypothetical protein
LFFGSPEKFPFGYGLFRISGSSHFDDWGFIPAFDAILLDFLLNPVTDDLSPFEIGHA